MKKCRFPQGICALGWNDCCARTTQEKGRLCSIIGRSANSGTIVLPYYHEPDTRSHTQDPRLSCLCRVSMICAKEKAGPSRPGWKMHSSLSVFCFYRGDGLLGFPLLGSLISVMNHVLKGRVSRANFREVCFVRLASTGSRASPPWIG